jgi:hypothetical protein
MRVKAVAELKWLKCTIGTRQNIVSQVLVVDVQHLLENEGCTFDQSIHFDNAEDVIATDGRHLPIS